MLATLEASELIRPYLTDFGGCWICGNPTCDGSCIDKVPDDPDAPMP